MNWFHESRLTLRLALPLMIGQLSQMLLGVADTLMVGHLGVVELAALTFANSLFHMPFVFGIGVLTGISVFSSNARGAKDAAGARASCRYGLALALGMGLALFAVSWWVSMMLDGFGQPPEVSERTTVYFRILMASMVPALASLALKNHADALNRPWPPFWIFLGGVGLNVFLNWVMIYGRLGCPALGLEGAAWATLISRSLILGGVWLWLGRARGLRNWVPIGSWLAFDGAGIRRLLTIGFPAGVQMLFEVSAFSVAGLWMGLFGKEALAAHQITITMAGLSFMIPLGLSMALTVRIGEANGSGDHARLRSIALSGWSLVFAYGLFACAAFLGFGREISSLFTDAPEVIELSVALLIIVGVFQIVDGLQVASSSMLRGLHDARLPAMIGLLSYWVVGIPVSGLLAFYASCGPCGVWWGLAAGLFVACITLGPRLWKRIARANNAA
jgi:MATE family multidrug resistance protein